MPEKKKVMIVSVGGTPAPIIFSLNRSRPEYICFFISKQTKRMLDEEIIPNLEFKPRHHDWVTTPNADSLSDCYSQLIKHLPELLEKWEINPKDVCVDYTGGTKTMSVALALATIERSCCYSYVGGDERSKGGVGIVINGKEKMHFLENPWDRIALAGKREASILFNKARYASAAEVLEKCIAMVSKEQQPFLKALREMVIGYDLWDRFKHREAKDKLYKSRDILSTFADATGKRQDKKLIDQLQTNLEFLDRIVPGGKPSVFHCYDLLSNARRRADLERKFDDAVARLYRAMEVLGQIELRDVFGIDTSDVKAEAIPESLREEFFIKYQTQDDQKIKIPLYASYQLLNELGSKLAVEFFNSYEKEIRSLLNIRNYSILAHGFNPVDQKTFEKLFDSIMKFSETKEQDLPKFPALRL
jgi:CRISPR-associated protein (TIGR02710 family)